MSDLTKLMKDEISKIADKKADYNFCLNRKQYKILVRILKEYRSRTKAVICELDASDDMALLGESAGRKKDLKRVNKLLKRLKV